MEHPTCDVCGKPATNAARNVYRIDKPEYYTPRFEPEKHIKYGCDEHPAESETIDIIYLGLGGG